MNIIQIKIIIFSFLFFFPSIGITQDIPQKEDGNIFWNENYKLKWSDFQANPPSVDQEWNAVCAHKILVKGLWDGLPNFIVFNTFLKEKSWANDTTSSHLLAHEQLHFDISEIYARKIRQTVDSLREVGYKKFEPYNEKIKTLLETSNKMHKCFDKETSHGVLIFEQEKWQEKVNKELEVLSEYYENDTINYSKYIEESKYKP